jgi:hypothetical protein
MSNAAAASWNRADLLAWLARHAEVLEPGVRLLEPLPESLRLIGADAAGHDPLGRPVLLLLGDGGSPEELLERLLRLATRARADAGALAPWFARPREPRLFLVAPELGAELRGRLSLISGGLSLRAWSLQLEGKAVERPRLLSHLPETLENPLGQAPAAPALSQALLRRLLSAAGHVRPRVEILGSGWPLLFMGVRGACAALHRDGEELFFVTERAARRTEVLRLADEESVDRALDVLLREQFSAVGSA